MNENLYISPCVGICDVDENTQKCIGCGRTRHEISKWIQLSHRERMIIMKRLGYGKRKNSKRTQLKSDG